MRAQSNSQKDHAAGVMPPIKPAMPWRVASIETLPGFKLRVEFLDGLSRFVEMAGLICSTRAGVFASLSDPAVFNQPFVAPGAVTWPGEIDLAPDAMRREIKRTGWWAP